MLSVVLRVVILLLSVLFRLAAAFRLTIPLLYALTVPTLFSGWYHSHQALAEGLLWASPADIDPTAATTREEAAALTCTLLCRLNLLPSLL